MRRSTSSPSCAVINQLSRPNCIFFWRPHLEKMGVNLGRAKWEFEDKKAAARVIARRIRTNKMVSLCRSKDPFLKFSLMRYEATRRTTLWESTFR